MSETQLQYIDVQDTSSLAYTLWRPEVCAISIFLYLSTIYTIRKVMANRGEFQLKNAMRVYNLAQVLLCGYMCYGLVRNPFTNFFRVNTPYAQDAEYFLFVHYLSKWLDYFDTVFMCLRKKDRQITTLHVFHHASIPAIWSILLYNQQAFGTTTLGAFANSAIHVIMYSHYFITSFGINNPFKKVVTQAQLMQFAILIVHSCVALVFETEIKRELCFLQTVYQVIMLSMFGSFYKKSYTKPTKKVA